MRLRGKALRPLQSLEIAAAVAARCGRLQLLCRRAPGAESTPALSIRSYGFRFSTNISEWKKEVCRLIHLDFALRPSKGTRAPHGTTWHSFVIETFSVRVAHRISQLGALTFPLKHKKGESAAQDLQKYHYTCRPAIVFFFLLHFSFFRNFSVIQCYSYFWAKRSCSFRIWKKDKHILNMMSWCCWSSASLHRACWWMC